MDDEEYTYQALQEPLYRVETGNYEYRLILRCRQEARKRFAALRSDVLVKLELLDQKHVHNIASSITKFISSLSIFIDECQKHLDENPFVPFELDLSKSCLLQTNTGNLAIEDYQDDDNNNNSNTDDCKDAIELAEDATLIDNIEEHQPLMSESKASDIQDLIDIFDQTATKSNNHDNDNDNANENENQMTSALSDLLLF